MEKRKYFEKPTQVCFWNDAELEWCAGIAYRDEIICGCCGGVFEIADLYDGAELAEIGEPIRELVWVSLVDEIVGDDWPFNPFDDVIEYEPNFEDNEG